MRAILIATGWKDEMGGILAYRPSPLLNIVGKPMAHHVMEYLYKIGVKHCDILLHHFPISIRNSLGDGSRWSIPIQYHLCKDATVPFKTLKPIIQGWNDRVVLLGTLEELPHFNIKESHKSTKLPILVCNPSKAWTKWGIFPLSYLINVPWDLPYDELPNFFHNKSKLLSGRTLLSVNSYIAYMKSNIKSLAEGSSSIHMPTTSKEKNHGVWVSKGTSIHPSAKIHPPVFLGENTFIDEGAEVGPNVVIEKNCIIDRNSKLSDSLVCKNSYIGEDLNVSNSVVDRNLLVNTTHNSEISIIEDFIISEVKTQPLKHYFLNIIEKFFAGILLLVFVPLIAVVWPFSRIRSRRVVSIPSHHLLPESHTFELFEWESVSNKRYPFLHEFISGIPRLVNILQGELHFVGLPPRAPDEINALPNSWKSLYLRSDVGIINLSSVEKGQIGDIDHQFACEVYQTMNKSPLFTLKLISRWLYTPSGSNTQID